MNVRAIGIAGVLALALAAAAAPASATATPAHRTATHKSVPSTPADRAATHAYLVAIERWDDAQLANAVQSAAAVEALASQISSECPGVLAGSPPQGSGFEPISSVPPASSEQSSARAEGERSLQSRQRDGLRLELSAALDSPFQQADHAATVALIGALAPLTWSNPKLTALLHAILAIFGEELTISAPLVCADLRSWVASGYKILSPASKEFAKHSQRLFVSAFALIDVYLNDDVTPLPRLLASSESRADRALVRHNEKLTARILAKRATTEASLKRVETALGVPAPKPRPPIGGPPRKTVVVGRGKTAAGGRFVVRAQPPLRLLGHSLSHAGCTVDVTVQEPRPSGEGLLSALAFGAGRCLSRSHVDPEQRVSCNTGLLSVEASLLPAARSVRLLLSDNRTIASPAIRVPARLGGPAGLYYQVVRGPSPIPVSLTELDAHGNTLTVLKLKPVVECTKHPHKTFPHGIVRLVHESLPRGPAFTIRAERYRELGQIHFELKFTEEPASEEFFSSDGGGGLFALRGEEGAGPPGRQVFESHASSGCEPQPYAIVYGLLKAPRDTVLVRVSGVLVPLRTVAIPAPLHSGGVLAYGAFSPLPTELLVRDAHSRTVGRKDLSEAAKSNTETCEGEVEG